MAKKGCVAAGDPHTAVAEALKADSNTFDAVVASSLWWYRDLAV